MAPRSSSASTTSSTTTASSLIGAANDGTTLTSPYRKLCPQVTQNQQLYSPSWNDTIEKQAGRAIMITFQIGLTRHEH